MARNTDTTKKQKVKKPKEEGRLYQIGQVFKLVWEHDRSIIWQMIGIFAIVFLVGLAVGCALWNPVSGILIGIAFGLLAAMFFFTRRAPRAMYKSAEGQAGVTSHILTNLGRGWSASQEPVAYNRQQDFIFRAVGKPGVVLVSEGPHSRVGPLLKSEEKRLKRILPNVPIYTIECGNGKGQTPLPDLTHKIKKLSKAISSSEVSAVNSRLASLGNRLPVPKGVDPMKARPDRKAMRGH